MTFNNEPKGSTEPSELITTAIYSALAGTIMFAMFSTANANDITPKAQTTFSNVNLSLTTTAERKE